jgi:DNA-binding NarL/FixJ family response regulator
MSLPPLRGVAGFPRPRTLSPPHGAAPREPLSSMRKLRTVIVEDETMFRQLVHSTLRQARDLQVTAAFELGKPALDYCLRHEIDLLVVDLVLPDLNGMEIVREIRRSRPEVLILIITAHPSAQLPAELIALGVNGYVDKTEPIEFVLKAIETVRHGGMFFASHVQAKTVKFAPGTARTLAVPLTRREEEIARMVASGKMSKEIAERLNLSLRTVEKHRENIMQKVGVHKVASLTRWCIESGLVGD